MVSRKVFAIVLYLKVLYYLKFLYKIWMKYMSHDFITMKEYIFWKLPQAIRVFTKLRNWEKFLFIIVTFLKLRTSLWIRSCWMYLSLSFLCQVSLNWKRYLFIHLFPKLLLNILNSKCITHSLKSCSTMILKSTKLSNSVRLKCKCHIHTIRKANRDMIKWATMHLDRCCGSGKKL